MSRTVINTPNAPQAIGPYSQAVTAGNTVYLSGQIPLEPKSMELISDNIDDQIKQVFDNLAAVAAAGGGTLSDIVKLTVFLTELDYFPRVNDIMAQYFDPPYPARAAVGVAQLPKGALVEMDAIMVLEE
jgi:reactive intermediate/imine deaminase